jgi:hypothetical protein
VHGLTAVGVAGVKLGEARVRRVQTRERLAQPVRGQQRVEICAIHAAHRAAISEAAKRNTLPPYRRNS